MSKSPHLTRPTGALVPLLTPTAAVGTLIAVRTPSVTAKPPHSLTSLSGLVRSAGRHWHGIVGRKDSALAWWLGWLTAVVFAWMFLTGWYAIVGMFIWPVAVPYRLIRGSQCKQLTGQHVEMLAAVER